jgi:hypothetical protein
MKLDRALVDAQVGGDLLVQFALHHVGEYFQFSFAERIESCSQFTLPGSRFAFAGVAREGTDLPNVVYR